MPSFISVTLSISRNCPRILTRQTSYQGRGLQNKARRPQEENKEKQNSLSVKTTPIRKHLQSLSFRNSPRSSINATPLMRKSIPWRNISLNMRPMHKAGLRSTLEGRSIKRLEEHVQSQDQPLIILGKSGSGKSASLPTGRYSREKPSPDTFLLMHFIGATPYVRTGHP